MCDLTCGLHYLFHLSTASCIVSYQFSFKSEQRLISALWAWGLKSTHSPSLWLTTCTKTNFVVCWSQILVFPGCISSLSSGQGRICWEPKTPTQSCTSTCCAYGMMHTKWFDRCWERSHFLKIKWLVANRKTWNVFMRGCGRVPWRMNAGITVMLEFTAPWCRGAHWHELPVNFSVHSVSRDTLHGHPFCYKHKAEPTNMSMKKRIYFFRVTETSVWSFSSTALMHNLVNVFFIFLVP